MHTRTALQAGTPCPALTRANAATTCVKTNLNCAAVPCQVHTPAHESLNNSRCVVLQDLLDRRGACGAVGGGGGVGDGVGWVDTKEQGHGMSASRVVAKSKRVASAVPFIG
jgi:hypothetical protein